MEVDIVPNHTEPSDIVSKPNGIHNVTIEALLTYVSTLEKMNHELHSCLNDVTGKLTEMNSAMRLLEARVVRRHAGKRGVMNGTRQTPLRGASMKSTNTNSKCSTMSSITDAEEGAVGMAKLVKVVGVVEASEKGDMPWEGIKAENRGIGRPNTAADG